MPVRDRVQIYGDFNDRVPAERGGYLQLEFSSNSIPLERRWRNNSLAANFIADYFTVFFPADPNNAAAVRHQTEIVHAIGYIANELLENATKYSARNPAEPIKFALHLLGDRLIFLVTNHVSVRAIAQLQASIEEISATDPNELYIQQLERSAREEDSDVSGLGFLSMMVDYFAKLAWKLEPLPDRPHRVMVTTMVELGI